jgi:hypothetical protein
LVCLFLVLRGSPCGIFHGPFYDNALSPETSARPISQAGRKQVFLVLPFAIPLSANSFYVDRRSPGRSEKALANFPNRWESLFLPRLPPSLPPKSGVWRSLPPICRGGDKCLRHYSVLSSEKRRAFCRKPLTCQWESGTTRPFQQRLQPDAKRTFKSSHTFTRSRSVRSIRRFK